MTIALSANTPRVSYTVSQGATQTSFTVPFVFFTASTDLNVFVDGTERTFDASTSSTSLYTVSGGNGSTGTVTTSVTGATGGSTVVITRDIPLSRTTDFPSSGAFEIAKLNTELDTLTAIQSDFNDNVDRTIRLQEFDDAATMTLPLKDARKGTVLGFNATTGAVEAGPTIANVNSLADITANINTVAGAITNVNNVGGSIANVNTVASNLSGVNSFGERYRVQSGVPSSDNDVGDLVFDTAANTLKVFGSSGFQNAGSSVNGTSDRFTYNITGTPTTLTGASGTGFAEAGGKTLAYDAGFIDVYLNGVKMVNGTDITVTSGNSVVFASALSNGDVVDIVTFGTFSLVSVGALDSGSITSGFGNINIGSSTITFK